MNSGNRRTPLHVIGLALVQAEPVAAMHHVAAAQHDDAGSGEASASVRPSQKLPPPVSVR